MANSDLVTSQAYNGRSLSMSRSVSGIPYIERDCSKAMDGGEERRNVFQLWKKFFMNMGSF